MSPFLRAVEARIRADRDAMMQDREALRPQREPEEKGELPTVPPERIAVVRRMRQRGATFVFIAETLGLTARQVRLAWKRGQS